MKQLTKLAMLAAAAALVSQAAHAAFTTNDLYLGFNGVTVQSDGTYQNNATDYIIDLGQPSAVGVGGTTVQDLSSSVSLSTLNNLFISNVLVTQFNAAVVGGNTVFPNFEVYATQVRVGGVGTASVAGSSVGAATSETTLSGAAGTLSGHPWPTAGNSTNDPGKSYSTYVGPQQVSGNFYSRSGVNPFGALDPAALAVIYLDLWHATTGNPYVYQGYFTLDLTGATAKLTFTPAAAVVAPPQPKLSITRAGGVSSISFLSSSNALYTLFYTNAAGLSAPVANWPSLSGTITGNGLTNTFQDATTDPTRLYKVKAQ